MTIEERAIPSAPDYRATSDGRIRSFTWRKSGRYMVPGRNRGGYLCVGLRVNGKRVTRTVHSLVAEAFLGPRPTGLHIDHVSGDKGDNSPGNLRYVTCAENRQAACDNGLAAVGERNPKAKLRAEQVADIRGRYAAGGQSHRSLAREFGVTRSVIGKILTRETWRLVALPVQP